MGETSKEKPGLSDWIHFIIHIRNLGYSLVGILISLLIITFGYLTIYSENLTEIDKNTLTVFSIAIVFLLLYLVYAKSSRLKMATKLLDLIMKRELNNIKEIEELWYKRKDIMYKKIIEFFVNHWIEIIGSIIIAVGIILIYLFCEEKNLCDFGKIVITVGLGIVAIGIGMSSDKKLKETQFIEFRRIKGQLEDLRLSLRERRIILENYKPKKKDIDILKDKINEFSIKYSFSIWKCYTYIDEINSIKKRLNDKEQISIIRLLALYYAELLYGRVILSSDKKVYVISKEYKGHLRGMYDIVTKFDVFKKIKDKILGKRLLEAKDMIMNDVIGLEEIKKLDDI